MKDILGHGVLFPTKLKILNNYLFDFFPLPPVGFEIGSLSSVFCHTVFSNTISYAHTY